MSYNLFFTFRLSLILSFRTFKQAILYHFFLVYAYFPLFSVIIFTLSFQGLRIDLFSYSHPSCLFIDLHFIIILYTLFYVVFPKSEWAVIYRVFESPFCRIYFDGFLSSFKFFSYLFWCFSFFLLFIFFRIIFDDFLSPLQFFFVYILLI